MFTKAVILDAGQGKRLLPLTEERPKCLLSVNGRTLLDWQISVLVASGIEDISVVTGFHTDEVEAALRLCSPPDIRVRALFNPFFAVSDNVGSCFMARDAMLGSHFVLLNGDTLFHPEVFARAMAQVECPITVTISRKERYDSDDMKVHLDGSRLRRIGKDLPPEQTDAESIGMLFFTEAGGREFVAGLDKVLRQPGGLNRWYLSVIDELAQTGPVGGASIEGLPWCEVDFPRDLEAARTVTASFHLRGSASGSAQRCGGA